MNQTEMFRTSGHMRDLMLNKSDENQEPVYNTLCPETRAMIERKSISVELINQRGAKIELNGSEWKLIDVLCELLHEQSINNNEPKEANFYVSRYGQHQTAYGSITAPTEQLVFGLYEITKKYKGEERVSGKDIETVGKILQEWDSNNEKRVLIRYKREILKTDKSKRVQLIEAFQPLIIIASEQFIDYTPDGKETKSSKDTIVYLNPIFRDQIETKYINYPIGLTKRMIEAWGGHDIPEMVFKLRDYLAREHSSKRFKCEISIEKLYWQLSEKWMKQGRRKRVHTYMEKSIQTIIKLGLIKEYSLEMNKKGEPKIIFLLNEKWT